MASAGDTPGGSTQLLKANRHAETPTTYEELMWKRGGEIVDQLVRDYGGDLTIGVLHAEIPYLVQLVDEQARDLDLKVYYSGSKRTAMAHLALAARAREISEENGGNVTDGE
jgi:hypothetical protein